MSAESATETKVVPKKPSPSDFMFGITLGEGAYARVVHARMKSTGEEYAVKIMEKRFIKKENKVKFVMMERKVFSKVCHNRIVKLSFTFQDQNYLYMVMEICRGGELLDVIRKYHRQQEDAGNQDKALPLSWTRFYAAEIFQALEYLHSHQIIHRDIKPENILLTEEGHLKITDFGTAKDESADDGKANTFCGTAEYVSPEVLRDEEASRGCDIWALGCMVFQMLVGRPMFRAENEYLTFQQILNHDSEIFEYPPDFPLVAKDFCQRIFRQNPDERLGVGLSGSENDYDVLKAHPFFDGVDWNHASSMVPPYRPTIESLPNTDNDGATEDWMFAGVATELQLFTNKSPKQVLQDGQQSSYYFNSSSPGIIHTRRGSGTTTVKPHSLWNRFLLDTESIRFSTVVSKRRGLFSKQRQLILTSKPRLIYIDPIRMRQKGEIPWSSEIYVQLKNKSSFDIVTPNRVYHITDSVTGSQRWSEEINAALLDEMRSNTAAQMNHHSN